MIISKNLPCGYEKRKKRKEEQHTLSKLFEISSSCSNTVSLENKSDFKINSVNTEINIKPSVELSTFVNEISEISTSEMLPYFSFNGTNKNKKNKELHPNL